MTLGGVGLRAYATFDLIIRTNKLWIAPYSQYQHTLYELILKMRYKGHTFAGIAAYLNEQGYQTTRGKTFKNAHVHSILKKKRIRDERLKKDHAPVLENFSVVFL